MNKFKRSQILILFGLISLLILTPFLSSSLRPTYLYFIVNLLIIALGAEAGFLSTFPKSSEEKKQFESASGETSSSSIKGVSESSGKKQKVIEKSQSEKIPSNVKVELPLKKCASTSSIFFIGEGEREEEEEEGEHGKVEEEMGNRQELFTQAETFIGNFYKQLKLQKEESWKNIHGFYQKGF